jgi:hypothetical protein
VYLAHQQNLTSDGAKMIKDKKKEAEMIQHWKNVIQITTTGDFWDACEQFAEIYGNTFGKYMRSNWLPVAEKYANAWTKQVTHFDHRTNSWIESLHLFIKFHSLGPNQSLTSTIKMIPMQSKPKYTRSCCFTPRKELTVS